MKSRFEALAYGMLGSVSDAEDVVQEAMLRLHQQSPAPQSDEAFLYRVVSNLSIVLPGTQFVGLFGAVDTAGSIRNLGIVGGSISGRDYVGGLAGLNQLSGSP